MQSVDELGRGMRPNNLPSEVPFDEGMHLVEEPNHGIVVGFVAQGAEEIVAISAFFRSGSEFNVDPVFNRNHFSAFCFPIETSRHHAGEVFGHKVRAIRLEGEFAVPALEQRPFQGIVGFVHGQGHAGSAGAIIVVHEVAEINPLVFGSDKAHVIPYPSLAEYREIKFL